MSKRRRRRRRQRRRTSQACLEPKGHKQMRLLLLVLVARANPLSVLARRRTGKDSRRRQACRQSMVWSRGRRQKVKEAYKAGRLSVLLQRPDGAGKHMRRTCELGRTGCGMSYLQPQKRLSRSSASPHTHWAPLLRPWRPPQLLALLQALLLGLGQRQPIQLAQPPSTPLCMHLHMLRKLLQQLQAQRLRRVLLLQEIRVHTPRSLEEGAKQRERKGSLF